MKTPRQLFCEQKEIATSAMEAVASTPVQYSAMSQMPVEFLHMRVLV